MRSCFLVLAIVSVLGVALAAEPLPPHSLFKYRKSSRTAPVRVADGVRYRQHEYKNTANATTVIEWDGPTSPLAGNHGIDISKDTCDGSSWVSAQQWPCFKSKGKNFGVVEAFNGGSGDTQSIAHCVSEGHKAGLAMSVYAFFCPNCGGNNNPPETAAANLVHHLKSLGVEYEYLWLDVELCDGCWNDAPANADFVRGLVKGVLSAGGKVAIYTNAYEWESVTGGIRDLAEHPLWYAHYDGEPNFNDWSDFGGWTKPHWKQYNDQSDVGCYAGVDVNWYP